MTFRVPKAFEIQVRILKAMLAAGEHISVRELARQAKIPPGHCFYHLKRLVVMGVLVKRNWTEEEGDLLKEYVEYEPQPMFTRPEALKLNIGELEELIVDSTPKKMGYCIEFLLRLSKLP